MKTILKAIFKAVYPYYFMWDQWARYYIVNIDVLFYESFFEVKGEGRDEELALRKELAELNRKMAELQKRGLNESQDAIDSGNRAAEIESEIHVRTGRRNKYEQLVQIKNEMRPYITLIEQWKKDKKEFF